MPVYGFSKRRAGLVAGSRAEGGERMRAVTVSGAVGWLLSQAPAGGHALVALADFLVFDFVLTREATA